MLVHKHRGLVFVVGYNEKNESDKVQLESLVKTYGDDRVLHRDFYTKVYKIREDSGKIQRVPMIMMADNNINRSQRREQLRTMKRTKYGEQKTNDEARTKHMKTRPEIQYERSLRKRR